MNDQQIAERIMKYQDEFYDRHGLRCAPIGDGYEAGIEEIIERMIEDGFASQITETSVYIAEDENAHMAASAALKAMKRFRG